MRAKAKQVKEEQEKLLQNHMDASATDPDDPYASYAKKAEESLQTEDEIRAQKQRDLMRYVIKREQ